LTVAGVLQVAVRGPSRTGLGTVNDGGSGVRSMRLSVSHLSLDWGSLDWRRDAPGFCLNRWGTDPVQRVSMGSGPTQLSSIFLSAGGPESSRWNETRTRLWVTPTPGRRSA